MSSTSAAAPIRLEAKAQGTLRKLSRGATPLEGRGGGVVNYRGDATRYDARGSDNSARRGGAPRAVNDRSTVARNDRGQVRCFRCHQPGHFRRQCTWAAAESGYPENARGRRQ